MRILVAESDIALGLFLEREFRAENYAVDLAGDANEAKTLARERHYDAAVLDLNVPQSESYETLRCVRSAQEQLPILILATRGSAEESAQLLDLGADDLVVKPFAFSELSARVRAILRRGGHYPQTVLRVEDLELSRIDRSVKRAGKKIRLTPKEFALLEYLMRNSGQRVTRMEIIQHVWNLSFDTMTNVVDVYINYLRKKVDAPCEHKLIRTVRGVGYQLQARNSQSGNAA
jgi:two-component system, OmpR family, copper resistance phosphate regulon response regulator CusR